MKTKEQILLEIERLKAVRPYDMEVQIHWLLKKLRHIEGDEC